MYNNKNLQKDTRISQKFCNTLSYQVESKVLFCVHFVFGFFFQREAGGTLMIFSNLYHKVILILYNHLQKTTNTGILHYLKEKNVEGPRTLNVRDTRSGKPIIENEALLEMVGQQPSTLTLSVELGPSQTTLPWAWPCK